MTYSLVKDIQGLKPWKDTDDFRSCVLSHSSTVALLEWLDFEFKSPANLVTALTHRSFINENRGLDISHNERLEFLGDAELGSYVTSRLFNRFPNMNEGELSRFRAALVNEESLDQIGEFLGLAQCLLVGKGEVSRTEGPSAGPVSDCFEAIIGALFLELGVEATRRLLDRLFTRLEERLDYNFWSLEKFEAFDSKTKLQEQTVKLYRELPEYRAHQIENQMFEVELRIKGHLISKEKNNSKKKAEKLLAYRAYKEKLYLMEDVKDAH